MNTTLILTFSKPIDYSLADVEFMLPSMMHMHAEGDSYKFDNIVREAINYYAADIGESAAYQLYYKNMYYAISELIEHGIDLDMLRKIVAKNDIVSAKITVNGDVFLKLQLKDTGEQYNGK